MSFSVLYPLTRIGSRESSHNRHMIPCTCTLPPPQAYQSLRGHLEGRNRQLEEEAKRERERAARYQDERNKARGTMGNGNNYY